MKNTEIFNNNGTTTIKFHGSIIAAWKGDIVGFNSQRFRTVTTKRRMNQVQNMFCVRQRKSVWYITNIMPDDFSDWKEYPFQDGICFNIKTGKPLPANTWVEVFGKE